MTENSTEPSTKKRSRRRRRRRGSGGAPQGAANEAAASPESSGGSSAGSSGASSGESSGEGTGRRRRRRRGRRSGQSGEAAEQSNRAPRETTSEDAPRKSSRRRGGRRRRRGGGDGEDSNATGGTPLQQLQRVARQRFGIRKLRPEQIEAMEAVLEGRDTLAVLPTGFGKSLIYQVPAMVLDGPTVVISPLIALMQDQQMALQKNKVPVVRLDSTLRVKERREALAQVEAGGQLIILTTPETLESEDLQAALRIAKPQLLCVDEAHCISEWGHDFRPAYLRVGEERKALGIPRVLALTATATPRVQADIARRLKLEDPLEVHAPPHRPNLHLEAKSAFGQLKFEHAGRILRRLQRPGIVYCATKQAVDDVYVALRKARIPVSRYHGGMKTDEREAEQKRFMKTGLRSVMVATSAFGMGIDKPDIRYIMHFHVPSSPEQYVQEAGRAGRDGRPSKCILLFDPKDLEIQEYLQERSRPNISHLRRVTKALLAWVDEGKPVEPRDLAFSANVPITTTRSLCADLEEAGHIKRERGKGYVALVDAETLEAGAADLASRFEIERRQDARRLRAIAEYAETEECRSVFIRKWFGEEDPPVCGNCDTCKANGDLKRAPRSGSRSRSRSRGGEGAQGTKKKSSRGGRSRRGRRSKKPAE